jgi:hypothetical protein
LGFTLTAGHFPRLLSAVSFNSTTGVTTGTITGIQPVPGSMFLVGVACPPLDPVVQSHPVGAMKIGTAKWYSDSRAAARLPGPNPPC